jgi:hypothetical protein
LQGLAHNLLALVEARRVNGQSRLDEDRGFFVLPKRRCAHGEISMSHEEVGIRFYSGVQPFEKDGYVGVLSCS